MPLCVRNLTVTHLADLRPLIKDLTFTLSSPDRLAVIGEEGDGKSTLLKLLYDPGLIAGYAAFSGAVSAPGERLGYLPQELPQKEQEKSVSAFCRACPAFLNAQGREKAALIKKLKIRSDMPDEERPVSSLSGGEKVKLQLLLMLLNEPTMLLMDEPGNDLDIGSLDYLTDFINTCGLPVLYISHDETLLSRTATRVLHLEQAYKKTEPRWTLKNIPYDAYMRERAAALDKQEHDALMDRREERTRREKFERIQSAVESAQNNVSRGDPHGGRLLKKKMKAVRSLEKRYDRERDEMTKRPNVEYGIALSFDGSVMLPSGKIVLDLSMPELRAGGTLLSQNVALRVAGPEKVVITGENGCGKTTLLRAIASLLLQRADIRAFYMPQRYEETLDETLTPVQFLHDRGDKERLTRARTFLGAAKFTTDEMEHAIGGLSGGQKAKLLLLMAILNGANVLLLDEPTRNLSPLSAPVIRDILKRFSGAVICVTHDRLLISALDARVLRLTEDGLVNR